MSNFILILLALLLSPFLIISVFISLVLLGCIIVTIFSVISDGICGLIDNMKEK